MKLLAFDLGASNGRAILGDLSNGKLDIKEIRRFPNDPVRTPTHLHWDTFRLLHEIQQGIVDCKNQTGSLPDSIGINTWGVDFGLVDKDGDLVFTPLHYRDEVRAEIAGEMAECITNEELFYRSAYINIASVETLYYLFKRKPHITAAANSILFTPDLLGFFLCGKRYAERSISSTSKLLDNETGKWCQDTLKDFGIAPEYFHEVVEPGTLVGSVLPVILDSLGLKGDVKVVAVAGHDTTSAAAAVPATEKDFAYISCGTWSIIGASAPKVIRTKEIYDGYGSFDCSVDGGTDIRSNLTGLWIQQEIKRAFRLKGEEYGYPEIMRLSQDAEPFIAIIDPDSEHFFHPDKMDEKVKQYCRDTGQRVPVSIGELSRVVLESLALKYRYRLDLIEKMLERDLPIVHMIGGGIQNELLCEFTASACQRPVKAGPVEATVFGNLLMQAKAMGAIRDIEEGREIIRASCEVKNYEPQDPANWEKQYELAKQVFS